MTTRQIHVVGAAIFDDHGLCLVTQRSAEMANALKWEFPGGKVEQGETPKDALAREIMEEIAISVEVGPWIAQGRAMVAPTVEVILDVYRAQWIGGEVRLAEHAQFQWSAVSDFGGFDWAEADIPIVDVMLASMT